MAAKRKQQYYWLRLFPAFFGSEIYRHIMELKDCDGGHIILIYIWLCTVAINKGGRLCGTVGKIMIPYDAERLCHMFTWYSQEEMANALDVLEQCELLWRDDDSGTAGLALPDGVAFDVAAQRIARLTPEQKEYLAGFRRVTGEPATRADGPS